MSNDVVKSLEGVIDAVADLAMDATVRSSIIFVLCAARGELQSAKAAMRVARDATYKRLSPKVECPHCGEREHQELCIMFEIESEQFEVVYCCAGCKAEWEATFELVDRSVLEKPTPPEDEAGHCSETRGEDTGSVE